MCEHKQVLAIYENSRHTRDNIAHYRCTECSHKIPNTYIFPRSVRIIYDE